jgi:hypothetical protein
VDIFPSSNPPPPQFPNSQLYPFLSADQQTPLSGQKSQAKVTSMAQDIISSLFDDANYKANPQVNVPLPCCAQSLQTWGQYRPRHDSHRPATTRTADPQHIFQLTFRMFIPSVIPPLYKYRKFSFRRHKTYSLTYSFTYSFCCQLQVASRSEERDLGRETDHWAPSGVECLEFYILAPSAPHCSSRTSVILT